MFCFQGVEKGLIGNKWVKKFKESSYVNNRSTEGCTKVLKKFLLEATDSPCEWTKDELYIEKHGDGRTILRILLVKRINFGKSRHRKTQIRKHT